MKVLDFGLAKLLESEVADGTTQLPTEALTRPGLVVGTPHYMSPEQAKGEVVDRRSDIFSLGVMLFEMATGQRPFPGASSVELLSSLLKDTPPLLTDMKPQLPRHLGRVVGRCLEKAPIDRFQTARDVHNELRALRKETSSVPMHPPSSDSVPRPNDRQGPLRRRSRSAIDEAVKEPTRSKRHTDWGRHTILSTMSAVARDVNSDDLLVGQRAEEAVPKLMARHGDKLFTVSLKFCGNREDAEDLVQETFLQAFRKWDQFEGRSRPSSWLYTIAVHGCQRMKRKRAGEPARIASLDELLPSGLALVAKLPSPEDGPLDDGLRREASEVVDRALAQLPVDFRLPLVLKEVAELSLREIAAILGVKEATVKTRVHRGRLALRAALTERLGVPGEAERDHPHQVCLDLLRSKMNAMDRGVEFPVHEQELCERCRAFIGTLDLATEACRWVRGGGFPQALRSRLAREFEREGSRASSSS